MATPVYYANCPDYTPEHLKHALEGILPGQIDAFGGVSGKRIMLKPNLLAWRRADDIACVHPKLIVETARFFLDAGAKEVALLENPAVQTAPAIIRAMGIDEELKKLGVHVANFSDYKRLPLPPEVKFHNIELAAEFLEYDAVADIAKAKTHAMMILTLCVKNLFGLVKGCDRMGWHLAVGRDFAKFADMLLDIYLSVRPRFNICSESASSAQCGRAQAGFLVRKPRRCSARQSAETPGSAGNSDGMGRVSAAVPQRIPARLRSFQTAAGSRALHRVRTLREDVPAAVAEAERRQTGVRSAELHPLLLLSGALPERGDHSAQNARHARRRPRGGRHTRTVRKTLNKASGNVKSVTSFPDAKTFLSIDIFR